MSCCEEHKSVSLYKRIYTPVSLYKRIYKPVSLYKRIYQPVSLYKRIYKQWNWRRAILMKNETKLFETIVKVVDVIACFRTVPAERFIPQR